MEVVEVQSSDEDICGADVAAGRRAPPGSGRKAARLLESAIACWKKIKRVFRRDAYVESLRLRLLQARKETEIWALLGQVAAALSPPRWEGDKPSVRLIRKSSQQRAAKLANQVADQQRILRRLAILTLAKAKANVVDQQHSPAISRLHLLLAKFKGSVRAREAGYQWAAIQSLCGFKEVAPESRKKHTLKSITDLTHDGLASSTAVSHNVQDADRDASTSAFIGSRCQPASSLELQSRGPGIGPKEVPAPSKKRRLRRIGDNDAEQPEALSQEQLSLLAKLACPAEPEPNKKRRLKRIQGFADDGLANASAKTRDVQEVPAPSKKRRLRRIGDNDAEQSEALSQEQLSLLVKLACQVPEPCKTRKRRLRSTQVLSDVE